MAVSYTIGAMQREDWDQVSAVYLEGVATGNATFEQEAPVWERWDGGHLAVGRLVARDGCSVLAWAALSPVSLRCVYAGVAEVSLYVGAVCRGRGIGTALLRELIAAAETAGFWTLQAGIFPENKASLALHRRCGFRDVGKRERIGRMNGHWRDVLLLERRSAIVGREAAP